MSANTKPDVAETLRELRSPYNDFWFSRTQVAENAALVIESLQAELAKAREVIRPFTLIPANVRPDASDYHQVPMNLGWLRAARAFQGEK